MRIVSPILALCAASAAVFWGLRGHPTPLLIVLVVILVLPNVFGIDPIGDWVVEELCAQVRRYFLQHELRSYGVIQQTLARL